MKTISGFTFIHNAIDSGYPIIEAILAVMPYVDEVVVVDMESTDETKHAIGALNSKYYEFDDYAKITILDGKWGNNSGTMLDIAYDKYIECLGDIILHFEADEVYDDNLLKKITANIFAGSNDIGVYRLQIEQNFQRCKWYPELVHRVWRRDSDTRKAGHTSDRHSELFELGPKNGYLWDISNCFRDQFIKRIKNMAKYRNEAENYLMVPKHCNLNARLTESEVEKILDEPHWVWQTTPFNIPEILKPLVGQTEYKP